MTQYPSDEELAIHKASEDSVSSIVHPPPPPERHWLTDFIPAHPVPAFIVMAAVVFGVIFASIQATNIPSTAVVTCTGDQAHDTKALQTAITNARNAGTVEVSAGTCNLNAHLAIKQPVTINGAGATATFLVQWARENIAQITSPGVTIESMSLDVGTHNPGVPPVKKNPVPSALFSAQSNTTLRDLNIIAGTGFGFRLTGPSPCDSYKTHGDVVSNVAVVNHGAGGFTSFDGDCLNGATFTSITIHGQYLALFLDQNVTLDGLNYTPDLTFSGGACHEPVFVTTKSTTTGIVLRNITGGGKIIVKPASSGVTISNQTKAPGC